MVRATRVELVRPCGQMCLGHSRLPIPPRPDSSDIAEKMETAVGVEPTYAVLQTATLPLGQAAVLELPKKT